MSYPPFDDSASVDGNAQINQPRKDALLPTIPHNELLFTEGKEIIIVIGKHKYYNFFNAQLIKCGKTFDGKLKAPLIGINPINHLWKETNTSNLKFYLAIIKFQTVYEKSGSDFESLKALLSNPFQYDFYFHDHGISTKLSASSLAPISVNVAQPDVKVLVEQERPSYKIQCEFRIGNTYHTLTNVSIYFDYFIVIGNNWYLSEDFNTIRVLTYFKHNGPIIKVYQDSFKEFKKTVLDKIELYAPLEYLSFKTPDSNSPKVKSENLEIQKIIYLSDLQNYVTINPVIRYGATEIPIRSKKQIYEEGTIGRIKIERNNEVEDALISLLLKQNPEFEEQLADPLLYFYVHKTYFLDKHWFLQMFEDWHKNDIRVFGFNELKDNQFNPHKAKISVEVSSGINWFKTQFNIEFGKTKATLKQLQKSLKNKSHYIELDDGTTGIIPEEWIEKFKTYFRVSDVTDDYTMCISKVNYSIIDSLYKPEELPHKVKQEITDLEKRLQQIHRIKPAPIPSSLRAALRPYQIQGLSWLNLLDDLNFGGCLADDMGLGKSLQVIAFILLLKEKKKKQTHLVVVPTILLHPWKEEIQKFAPTVSVHIQHGVNKIDIHSFDLYDVILTSYGTLISEIVQLSRYVFGYIFLDESQNIKNASSQRYKASRLLQSTNKIIISGTPFENSVLDLYAQFSFACPGLLGSRQYFRDIYAIPIGKFKSKKAAAALQSKINPFILRRTKQQVIKELPEKTEMVLYCEMGDNQRALYAKQEKEFRDFISMYSEEDIPKHTVHILKGLTRLRQICNSPVLLKEEKVSEEESSKLDVLIDRIASVCANHKVLVFSQFVSMLDLIGSRLTNHNISYSLLTGKTSKKETVVHEFQHDKSVRVFLISLKAGGTGLNLTAADYVFIVDPWWNPAVENQAIDRVYRIGQTKKVIAVRLICKNSIEEKMMTIQQSKELMAHNLINPEQNILSAFSKSDLISLLSD